jgi:lysozyme
MRHPTEVCLTLMRAFEGFRATPYKCLGGVWTQGYGSTGPHVTADSTPITEADANLLLVLDADAAARAVLRNISVPLTDGQFDALTDFCFNLGGGALQRSRLRAVINRGEHQDVEAELLKWCKAGGVVVRGLLRRRYAEANLYNGG